MAAGFPGHLTLVRSFDREFTNLHNESRAFIEKLSIERLYRRPTDSSGRETGLSCGELILRSAGGVEQVFGGITANLWDDPFEWTLPETLRTLDGVIDYLEEVGATRRRGLALLAADDDLYKQISVPSMGIQSLFSLLLSCIVRASHYQGRAIATAQGFSTLSLSGA